MRSIPTLLLIITLLINFNTFSQKDKLNCKSATDVSKDSSRIESYKIQLTTISKFKLRMSIVVTNSEPYLLIESLSTGIPNKKVNLGEEITITIHFENGSEELVRFDSAQKQGGIDYPNEVVFNELKINRDFIEKLSSVKIVKVSALNPYGKLSEVTTNEQNLTRSLQDRTITVATCMLMKIDEMKLTLK